MRIIIIIRKISRESQAAHHGGDRFYNKIKEVNLKKYKNNNSQKYKTFQSWYDMFSKMLNFQLKIMRHSKKHESVTNKRVLNQ